MGKTGQMDVDEVLSTGLDRFDGVLAQVAAQDWDRPSTCSDWTARELTGHVLGVLDSAVTLLQGGSPDWGRSADLSTVGGSDPVAAFRERADAARAALPTADLDTVMETPMGPLPTSQRLAFPAMDLHLHAWDLGRTIGVEVVLPQEISEFVHGVLDPMPEEMMRRDGVFAPEVLAPEDASTTEALIAWTGRDPRA